VAVYPLNTLRVGAIHYDGVGAAIRVYWKATLLGFDGRLVAAALTRWFAAETTVRLVFQKSLKRLRTSEVVATVPGLATLFPIVDSSKILPHKILDVSLAYPQPIIVDAVGDVFQVDEWTAPTKVDASRIVCCHVAF